MALLNDRTFRDFRSVQRGFEALARTFYKGNGTPEGKVAAKVGSVFFREDGGAGTTLYVKETGGAGKTGWAAK